MCLKSGRQRKSVELADIFSQHADAYIASHGVSSIQHKAINAIAHCRTAALGGHVLGCDHCGALEISYNSCRYRHCPKCQKTKQLRWLEARKSELLPVPYFHVVFTLPHELNPLASYNASLIYNLLFKTAWATIDTLGHDKKRLNGRMGMFAFLHTWSQTINQHIHLHCMIPAGALCNDDGNTKWQASKVGYLFPVKVMSKLFGKLFLTTLSQAFEANEFQFKGCIAELAKKQNFMKLKVQLYKKTWNVYAKEPFNGAQGGMEYLARYFTKTAIGNERLISCDEQQVAFKWRDSADNNNTKVMKLNAHEFIRRYLLHILPHGFMRARYFGFLANAVKAKNTTLIRSLLPDPGPHEITGGSLPNGAMTFDSPKKSMSHALDTIGASHTNHQSIHPIEGVEGKGHSESVAELMKRCLGIDINRCKQCGIGRLEKIKIIRPNESFLPTPFDTS